jgi:nicotinamide-nucleotide amidase
MFEQWNPTWRSIIENQVKLDHLATAVFNALEQTGDVLVLAESCTAGLIAATLARIPRMSRRLAGSFVVYQTDSKTAWLGISSDMIQQHDVVSRVVAESMATQALDRTPHASIAMSITGHLGPESSAELDGVAWLAIARRERKTMTKQLQLKSDAPGNPLNCRHDRQTDAVHQALSILLNSIS